MTLRVPNTPASRLQTVGRSKRPAKDGDEWWSLGDILQEALDTANERDRRDADALADAWRTLKP